MKCAYGVVRNREAVEHRAHPRRESVAHPEELTLGLYLLLISRKALRLISYKLATNARVPILRDL